MHFVVGNQILAPFDLLCFLCFINEWNLRVAKNDKVFNGFCIWNTHGLVAN